MAQFRKIGVITSGGDAQPMNAAVRAVTLAAADLGIEAVGINEAYYGMARKRPGDFIKLTPEYVENIISIGGTILNSARFPEFKEEANVRLAAKNLSDEGIDGLIAIGGDGTFRGAQDLLNICGVPCVGVPATIDNDITATDFSIGFDTALNETMQMADCLRNTCNSHKRCNVIETMGRGAGYIALQTAIAVGASAAIIPEKMNGFDRDALISKLIEARKKGKRSFIIMVSEGVENEKSSPKETVERLNAFIAESRDLSFDTINAGDGKDETKAKMKPVKSFIGDFFYNFKAAYSERLAADIEKKSRAALKEHFEKTGDLDFKDEWIETKFARFAHIVRGGSPTLRDRLMASQMGDMAVRVLADGKSNCVICLNEGKLSAMDFNEALWVDKLYRAYNAGNEDKEAVEKMTDEQKRIYYRRIKEMDEMYALANRISEV